MTTERHVPPGDDGDRTGVAEAIAAWEARGPTSLTVALMADALYGVRDAATPARAGDDLRETFAALLTEHVLPGKAEAHEEHDPEENSPMAENSDALRIATDRTEETPGTGILVRATMPDGRWVNADIAQLDKDSLVNWLRSRGGNNPWAESVVCHLLGHR